MTTIQLFSTAGCHLCEQAEALALPLLESRQWQLELVDISVDAALVERYGIRIPVLGAHDSAGRWQELGWPFDQAQIGSWLGQINLMCQGS